MRCLIQIFLIIVLAHTTLRAQDTLGQIVSIMKDVDIISLSTGTKIIPEVGTGITADHQIRTGNGSSLEIILNDGTKLFIKEVTVLNVASLKLQESDPPTKIAMFTGKLRITLKKLYNDRSLILNTPTAIAGVRGTDFGVITSKKETKIAVFSGEIEVANINERIIKSYIVKEKEQVSIMEDSPPTEPIIVPQEILKIWFDYYTIDERNHKIIRKNQEEGGIIDKLLRNKY